MYIIILLNNRMKKSLIQERDEARRKAAQLEIENEQHKEELEELKEVSPDL